MLHDSLAAALADTRRRDLLDQAERFRTARHVRAAVRAARAVARREPPATPPPVAPPEPGVREETAPDRRYAVSR